MGNHDPLLSDHGNNTPSRPPTTPAMGNFGGRTLCVVEWALTTDIGANPRIRNRVWLAVGSRPQSSPIADRPWIQTNLDILHKSRYVQWLAMHGFSPDRTDTTTLCMPSMVWLLPPSPAGKVNCPTPDRRPWGRRLCFQLMWRVLWLGVAMAEVRAPPGARLLSVRVRECRGPCHGRRGAADPKPIECSVNQSTHAHPKHQAH